MYFPPPTGVCLTTDFSSKTLPITTPSGYIIALLAGRPASSTWDSCMLRLTGIMRLTKDAMRFGDHEDKHRRGTYTSVNTGISYGGGARVSQRPFGRGPPL